jgi:hypothetical protein
MPTFRLEDEQGRWLTDVRLNAPTWKPGDRIPGGRDTLEVVEVRIGRLTRSPWNFVVAS